MKSNKKIFYYFIFLAFIFWILESIANYLIFDKSNFPGAFTLQLSGEAIILKSVFIFLFLIAGYIFTIRYNKGGFNFENLSQTNRTLKLLRECNQALILSKNKIELLESISKTLYEIGGYDIVWIADVDDDEEKTIIPIISFGIEIEILKSYKLTYAENKYELTPMYIGINERRNVIVDDINKDRRFKKLAIETGKFNITSIGCYPLIFQERLLGVLNLYKTSNHIFKEDEKKLLNELAMDISYGIHSFMQKELKEIAEDSLQYSELKYRTLLDNANDAIMVIKNSRLEQINQKTIELFKFRKDNILYKFLWDLSPKYQANGKNSKDYALEILTYALNGKNLLVEWVFQKFDGELFYSENSLSLIEISNEKLIQIIVRDITERKNQEKALKESEERFRYLYRNTPIMLHSINKDGKIINVSEFWLNVLGYNRDEVINNYLTNFMSEESKQYAINIIFPLFFKTGFCKDIPYSFVKKDGEKIEVLLTANAELDRNGRVIRSLAVMVDVTEMKLAIADKLESDKLYRSTVDSMDSIIHVVDINLNILLCNKKYKESLEALNNFENPIGKNVFELKKFLPNRIRNEYNFVLETGEILITEENNDFLPKPYWTEVKKIPMFDEEGKVYRIITIINDITEKREYLEKLKSLNRELDKRVQQSVSQYLIAIEDLRKEIEERRQIAEELFFAKEEIANALEREKELSDLKNRFISMVSHEYRTPLTVILSASELLDKYYQTQKREMFDQHLIRIKQSVDVMTNLLDEILTIGRLESGKETFMKKPHNLVDLLSDIVEESEIANGKRNIITFKPDVASLIYNSDEFQLRHIFSNLLSNAAKYSPENESVSLELIDNTLEIVVIVKDKGIGIPENEINFIFEPFYRCENIENKAGTGLGLAIVKKCVDNLKGAILVNSQYGLGSTFTVTLPKSLDLI